MLPCQRQASSRHQTVSPPLTPTAHLMTTNFNSTRTLNSIAQHSNPTTSRLESGLLGQPPSDERPPPKLEPIRQLPPVRQAIA